MITTDNVFIPLVKDCLKNYIDENISLSKLVTTHQFSKLKGYLIYDEGTSNYYIYDETYKIRIYFEKKGFENYFENFPSGYKDNIENCMILITKYKLDLNSCFTFSSIRTFDFVILVYDFVIDKSQLRNTKIKLSHKDLNSALEIKLLKQFFLKYLVSEKVTISINDEGYRYDTKMKNDRLSKIYNTPTLKNMGYGVFRLVLFNINDSKDFDNDHDHDNSKNVIKNKKEKKKAKNKKTDIKTTTKNCDSNQSLDLVESKNINDYKDAKEIYGNKENEPIEENLNLEDKRTFLFSGCDEFITKKISLNVVNFNENDEKMLDDYFKANEEVMNLELNEDINYLRLFDSITDLNYDEKCLKEKLNVEKNLDKVETNYLSNKRKLNDINNTDNSVKLEFKLDDDMTSCTINEIFKVSRFLDLDLKFLETV